MNIRDKLQEKWCNTFLEHDKGILHLCPRSGKTNTSINIFKKIGKKPKILIVYPDKNIEQSWKLDFEKFKYSNPNIHYSTHISLHKLVKEEYDMIVVDEIHLLSMKQKTALNAIIKTNKRSYILGLSGTLSEKTEIELKLECKLDVLENYTLNQAIEDGLIADYKINVIKVDLDNSEIVDHK